MTIKQKTYFVCHNLISFSLCLFIRVPNHRLFFLQQARKKEEEEKRILKLKLFHTH
jgi:hypothetical protein